MRKTILGIFAIFSAIVVFLKDQIGVSIEATTIAATMAVIATYFVGEYKNDIERFKKKIIQSKKWNDPTFWTALLASVLPIVNEKFGLKIPIETVTSVVVLVMGTIFAKRHKEIKNGKNK